MSKPINRQEKGINGGVSANHSPRSLIKSLKNGDISAFNLLVEQKDMLLKNFLFKLLNSKEDAEEVAHDVFIYVWQKRDYIDENKSIDAFLFHIARGRAIDRMRERNRFKSLLQSEYHRSVHYADSPEEMTELNEAQKKLDRIVANMPDVMQRIYKRKFIDGLSNQEIADELSITASSVRTQIERAIKKVGNIFDVEL